MFSVAYKKNAQKEKRATAARNMLKGTKEQNAPRLPLPPPFQRKRGGDGGGMTEK